MAEIEDSVGLDAAGYEAAANTALVVIERALRNDPELRSLDALDLWERLDPLVPPALPVDPGVTVMQWSAALDVARQRLGLAPLPGPTIAVVGEMAGTNVRHAARIIRDGRIVDHGAAVCFHCSCGWVSDGRATADLLGSEISWHLADVHW